LSHKLFFLYSNIILSSRKQSQAEKSSRKVKQKSQAEKSSRKVKQEVEHKCKQEVEHKCKQEVETKEKFITATRGDAGGCRVVGHPSKRRVAPCGAPR
jgi:predicted 2-oxoglutarate/Fe(II)-dependent dioxygenase YbiX